jgi:exodeoxyribonuclease VII large subunit
MPANDNRRIYGVSELTRFIKSTLEDGVGQVWVEGELSNVRQPASGHYYFTIKDASAQISGVLFRGNQRGLNFRLQDGLAIRAFGQVSVYERSGNYQIIVRTVEEAGKGSLQAQFEALKEKLQQEGLFEPSRKRPIPVLPRHVGVVTSPTGAAIRDILNVITRRFPNLHVVLAPARVQGESAGVEVAAAIDLLSAQAGLDVMIVGRGGGSLEDLWCFNEEVVARAIARAPVPVISAVGHEIDFTISDFVADLRAPTPSAAAELVVTCKEEFEQQLVASDRALTRALGRAVQDARARLRAAESSYVFREPGNLAGQYRQRLDALMLQMRHRLTGTLRDGHQRLDTARMRMDHEVGAGARMGRQRLDSVQMRLEHEVRAGIRGGLQALDEHDGRMAHTMSMRYQASRQQLQRLEGQLRALNPLAVLQRGYSVTRDASGRIIRSTTEVKTGQRVDTQVSDGRFESEVIAD